MLDHGTVTHYLFAIRLIGNGRCLGLKLGGEILLALHHRQADAAGGGDILVDLPVVRKAIDASQLVLLAKTEPLLFLPWAVKRTMPAALRVSVQSTLVELDRTAGGPARFRIEADASDEAIRDAFPTATREGGAVVVTVGDARELSDRLAALLARGAVVRSVTPAGAGLEARMRDGEASS